MSQFVIMFGLSLSHYIRLNLFDYKEKNMNPLSMNMYIYTYICVYIYVIPSHKTVDSVSQNTLQWKNTL